MSSIVVPCMTSVVLVLAAGLYAQWRTRCQRRHLIVERLVAVAVLVHLALAVPVGFLTAAVSRALRPEDDWWDIYGFGGAVLCVVMAPVAGVSVWLLGRQFERARQIAEAGHFCRSCGYDLTGNVSGRCPECGRPVPAPGADRGA